MQKIDDVTLQLGDAEIRVPAQAAARAYLEKFLGQTFAQTLPQRPHGATPPAIGQPFKGGLCAGLTLFDNTPMHLVLLPDDAEDLTWQKAKDWALEREAELPTRIDALVLFQNLKDQFKPTSYWTSSPFAGDDACAWSQDFNVGSQYYWGKSYELRARAVRRFIID